MGLRNDVSRCSWVGLGTVWEAMLRAETKARPSEERREYASRSRSMHDGRTGEKGGGGNFQRKANKQQRRRK
ncbi:uncharacterized protein SPSK_10732 [Sporothrix schenckii 1099-18]|uniref:Uncharacterized protein n=1 Tax=Sporothrix schenckii 1099-18 TaxID=1397361 RepID=A0A0F2MP08_SPOSC|nr:uncharacterized protein SPSK_10732 [Sporothrix schenckii 1099-18]KJR89921.1 hypothetical protein SPSK_10732 [Sporothrix schenckii 1099-18]